MGQGRRGFLSLRGCGDGNGGCPPIRAQGAASAEAALAEVSVAERRIASRRGMPAVPVFVRNAGLDGGRPGILHPHVGGHVLGTKRTALFAGIGA